MDAAHVEIGKHGGEQLDRLIRIDDLVGFGKQRHRANVGRQHFAVAVEKIRTRNQQLVGARDGRHRFGRPQSVLHQPPANDGVEYPETGDGDDHAVLRLSALRLAHAFEAVL